MRVAVGIVLYLDDQAFRLKVLDDVCCELLVGGVSAGEPIEAVDINAGLVQGSDADKVVLGGQLVVFSAAAGGDMDDT